MDQPKYPERILVQSQGKLITIAVKDIIRVEAYGDYSKLITDTGVYLSNFGISVLEEKFNNTILIRVHRSSIINLNKVKELNKYTKSYDVIMQNEDVVRVSRGYMDNIKRLMF
nr:MULTISPECIES: LytTR family DNA-binding domain-containing protein [unclassified Aquimarina]